MRTLLLILALLAAGAASPTAAAETSKECEGLEPVCDVGCDPTNIPGLLADPVGFVQECVVGGE